MLFQIPFKLQVFSVSYLHLDYHPTIGSRVEIQFHGYTHVGYYDMSLSLGTAPSNTPIAVQNTDDR
jgi:hypothetical protein